MLRMGERRSRLTMKFKLLCLNDYKRRTSSIIEHMFDIVKNCEAIFDNGIIGENCEAIFNNGVKVK